MVEVAASLVSQQEIEDVILSADKHLVSLQTQAYAAAQSPPLQLIGIYHAPSDVASSKRSELNPAAIKLAQSISTKLGSEAVVLQVDNSLLSSTTSHALKGFSVSAGSGSPLPSTSVQLEDETSVARIKKATASESWKSIFDFDGETDAAEK